MLLRQLKCDLGQLLTPHLSLRMPRLLRCGQLTILSVGAPCGCVVYLCRRSMLGLGRFRPSIHQGCHCDRHYFVGSRGIHAGALHQRYHLGFLRGRESNRYFHFSSIYLLRERRVGGRYFRCVGHRPMFATVPIWHYAVAVGCWWCLPIFVFGLSICCLFFGQCSIVPMYRRYLGRVG